MHLTTTTTTTTNLTWMNKNNNNEMGSQKKQKSKEFLSLKFNMNWIEFERHGQRLWHIHTYTTGKPVWKLCVCVCLYLNFWPIKPHHACYIKLKSKKNIIIKSSSSSRWKVVEGHYHCSLLLLFIIIWLFFRWKKMMCMCLGVSISNEKEFEFIFFSFDNCDWRPFTTIIHLICFFCSSSFGKSSKSMKWNGQR